MLEELSQDIKRAAEGIIEQAQIERGAQWIEAFANEFPVAYKILMATLYQEPKDVLRFLSVLVPDLRQYRHNEYVLKYIAMLQEEIRGKRDDRSGTNRNSKTILPVRRS